MAVQHFDQEQAQELPFGQGGKISTGKGRRSVVGHSWGVSDRVAVIECFEADCWRGLLYVWPGKEG